MRDAKSVEGLRAGDFVNEVQVDVEEGRFAGRLGHDVATPNLVEECGRGHNYRRPTMRKVMRPEGAS